MAFVKKQQGSNPGSLLHSGDAFFITEVDMKQDIQSTQAIVEDAMNRVADEMGLTTDQDLLDIEKLIHHEPQMVPMLIEEIEQRERQLKEEEQHPDIYQNYSSPTSPAVSKRVETMTFEPILTDSLREKEAIIQNLVDGNASYKMPLKTAIQ
jgi:hypothetical protein